MRNGDAAEGKGRVLSSAVVKNWLLTGPEKAPDPRKNEAVTGKLRDVIRTATKALLPLYGTTRFFGSALTT